MARLKQKGKAGAAKAYVTRSAAVKKLQISLADFRRLCILKGIFPREPRHRKKANKGSSVPTTFYYAKDIAYLAHEPVLRKLREHKAFAKKLSRAIGRGEWSTAKSLDDHKPTYRLDHIIKERYPTFIDAVRDIDDALCMIFLFANLPATSRVSTTLIDNCTRLAAEWQLYIIHSHSLRKVFLSIKGVYYQAEVMGQSVTWLVPYQFTQNIPADVDVRVMLTFLELYQTLLGFVFFKLYADVELVYPPPLDTKKDDAAAGVGAFTLQQVTELHVSEAEQTSEPKVSAKDVRRVIKIISSEAPSSELMENMAEEDEDRMAEDDFVLQPSKSNPEEAALLSTFKSLSAQEGSIIGKLFRSYTFWLSRETSRSIFEFVVRACGGRIGWPASSGSGSSFDESDETITHVIIDRPLVELPNETQEERQLRLQRKYIQPQWVVDCINAGKILLEDKYAQGKPLPPHFSPFGDHEGAYDPTATNPGDDVETIEIESDEEEEDAKVGEDEPESRLATLVADVTDDPDALHAAELEAEAAGIDHDAFERQVKKTNKSKGEPTPVSAETEEEMNQMLMSNKKRKLYERMKYGQRKKDAERTKLEQRRKELDVKQRRRKEKVVHSQS